MACLCAVPAVAGITTGARLLSAQFQDDVKPSAPKATTGSAAGNLDQCANGAVGAAPIQCTSNAWVNGNLNENKAHYLEGQSIPYRLAMSNLSTTGTHAVIIEWDTIKGDKHAIDYLTTFSRTETTAEPCSDVPGCNPATATTYAIPAQPDVVAGGITQIPGRFTLYGGSITALSPYSVANSGDHPARITISFTTSVSNPVLAWGGHIADGHDWGSGTTAVNIPGSPYHTRFIDLDGKGGNQDRSLSATAVIYPASITITKDAQPDGPTDFAFTTTGTGLSNFSLDDDNDPTLPNTRTFSGITSFGPKTVTETDPGVGWALSTLVCTEDQSQNTTTSVATRTASIALEEGEIVSCTFTNSSTIGTLRVIKNVINDEDGTLGASAFTLHVKSGAKTNADVTDNTCAALAGTTVAPGADVTCSFTATVSGNAGSSHTDTVTGTVTDDESNEVSDTGSATVTVTDTAPAVSVDKSADPTSVAEPSGAVSFTVTITNDSVATDPVTITALSDDVYGDLLDETNAQVTNNTCSGLGGQIVEPGSSLSCSFQATVGPEAGIYTDVVTATGHDDEDNETSGHDDASVTITDVPPSITVDKTAGQSSMTTPGGPVTFTVKIDNDSVEPVTLTGLTDDVYGDLLDANNDAVENNTCAALADTSIPTGESVTCSFDATVGPAAGIYTDHVTATVTDNEGNETTDDGTATVIVGDKTSCPATHVAPGGSISYEIPYGAFGSDATNLTITDVLPTGFRYASATPAPASAPAVGSAGTVAWTFPSVPAGTVGHVTIDGTIDPLAADGTTLTNTVTIAADGVAPAEFTSSILVSTQGSNHDERAYGVSVNLLGSSLIDPLPDTDDGDPSNEVLAVPASPAADVHVLKTSEGGSTTNAGSTSTAVATTAAARLLEQTPGHWLVTADAIKAVSSSSASIDSAASGYAGSTLANVTVAGQPLGDVSNPTTVVIDDPILHTQTTVTLLEQIARGAKAGIDQPDGGVFSSGLTVNAIHVTVRDADRSVIADIVVASASSDASFVSGLGCGDGVPHVSGNGAALDVAAALLDEGGSTSLTSVREAAVVLPSTGGSDDATTAHVGPISLAGHTIAESNTAFAHTEGTVDRPADAASSSTEARTEKLRLLDTNADPAVEDFLISADVVRATSSSEAAGSTASSVGDATILDLKIGGLDVCSTLALESLCNPDPNTEIDLGFGVVAVLNEQIADPQGPGLAGLTVNAIHVWVLAQDNPFGLPVGAQIIVSQAHSDARAANGSVAAEQSKIASRHLTIANVVVPGGPAKPAARSAALPARPAGSRPTPSSAVPAPVTAPAQTPAARITELLGLS